MFRPIAVAALSAIALTACDTQAPTDRFTSYATDEGQRYPVSCSWQPGNPGDGAAEYASCRVTVEEGTYQCRNIPGPRNAEGAVSRDALDDGCSQAIRVGQIARGG